VSDTSSFVGHSTCRIGRRKTAVLAILADRGRSTGLDIAKCATRDYGVRMTWDGALGEAVALEDAGLVEKADPHLDERGRLRGTWVLTADGRSALAQAQGHSESRVEPGQVWLCLDHLESGEGCTCGLMPYLPRAEAERLRDWLREFARRIERDRREPDKLLIEVTSMRAIADGLRDSDAPGQKDPLA
jgi:hypothetical protein